MRLSAEVGKGEGEGRVKGGQGQIQDAGRAED